MSEDPAKPVDNPMYQIKLEKVVVNMAVGRSGEPLQKGMKVLEELTGCKPCSRKAKTTIKTFGIRMGEPIACLVTLRDEKAESFLRKALETVSKLSPSAFDDYGNISFGVKEHIEMPGARYDPNLGIYGFNVNISLERPGFRVKRRSFKRSKVGRNLIISKEEAIDFVRNRFGVEVGEE